MGRIVSALRIAPAALAAAGARAAQAVDDAGGQAARSGAAKLHEFGLAAAPVDGPGIGRVLLAFLLVAALAWGATWLLKRYGFRSGRVAGTIAAPIRHLARGALPGGVVCHVVEAQGRLVLITASRQGVTSLVLGDAPAPVVAAAPPPTAPAPAEVP